MKKSISRKSFFKKVGVLSVLPLAAPFTGSSLEDVQPKSSAIKVLTCNIRVDLEEDRLKGLGWDSRKAACAAIVKRQKADVIGFQEVLKNQFRDLKDSLPDYYGVNFDGPEMDMHTEGYHGIAKNPIFFSKRRFELLAAGGYWLSETPLVAGSISWGSARARNVSWVRLYDRVTKRDFRVLNLHLDHVSNAARIAQVKMVLEEAEQYQAGFPQVLMGDFNAKADSDVIRQVLSAGWQDSYTRVHGPADPGPTTHDFTGLNDPRKNIRKKIDFIFTKGRLHASQTAVVRDSYRGIYPSDHYFVWAVLELP